MKLNLKVRFKHWVFLLSLISTILAAMGVSAESLTSWDLVWTAIVDLVNNPFQLGCVIVAIVGVFTDPTTKGIGDSEQAMTYIEPKG